MRTTPASGVTARLGAFEAVITAFRQLGYPFWLARTLLDASEWLLGQDRREQAGPLLTEAAGLFRDLQATPWVERACRVLPAAPSRTGPAVQRGGALVTP
ncbi:MAG: hypothetical protein M3Q75_01905 [Gemmatimonadota bacterium]|nr:hypothetical protein [Gemmatimonadota bacterium]